MVDPYAPTEDIAEMIVSILGFSQEEALTVGQIAHKVGLPQERTGETVRAIIRTLLDSPYHVPVVSSTRGYWIAACTEDVEQAIAGLQKRALSITHRADAILEAWLVRNDTIPDTRDLQIRLVQ